MSHTRVPDAGLAGPAAADGVANSKALIEKYSKLPSFVAPGPAFDAKACMKDKKIFAIPLTDDNPFEVAILGGMQNAAKIVGFDFHAGRPSSRLTNGPGDQQGCRGALQSDRSRRRPAAGNIAPQIGEARGKGVKVVTTHDYDFTQTPPTFLDGSGGQTT